MFVMITQAIWVVGIVLLMITLNETFRRTRSLRRAKCNETKIAATVANPANTVPTADAAAMVDSCALEKASRVDDMSATPLAGSIRYAANRSVGMRDSERRRAVLQRGISSVEGGSPN